MTVWEYYETDGDSGNYGSMLFTTEAAAKAYKLAKNDAYGQISKVTVHESSPLKPPVKRPAGSVPCRACTGYLIRRSGKFGSFLGCVNWPTCKYTEDDRDYYPGGDFD